MSEALVYREITLEDIDALGALIADAFAGYRGFAPVGWRPPAKSGQVAAMRRWITDADFWGELALDGETLVGHATFIPAARHTFRALPEPALAHLGHLFLAPEYWGSGAARHLLARATGAASDRGFNTMRLFVPVGQSRARRFYTRERFVAIGEPFDFGLGLPVLEYRRTLSS